MKKRGVKKMKKKQILGILIVICILLGTSGNSYSALFDRGGGMIYDDDLNITWIADANYAVTSGYDVDGRMTWTQGIAWADTLIYGGYSDWRLPTALNADGSGPCGGFAICAESEMGHLYYNELGGTWGASILNSGDPDLLLFNNIQSGFSNNKYWSSTLTAQIGHAWYFQMYGGVQAHIDENNEYFVWAIRDGDVSPIPEPGTILLFGSGFLGIVAYKKRHVDIAGKLLIQTTKSKGY